MKSLYTLFALFSLLFVVGCANQDLSNSGHIKNFSNLREVKTSKLEKHKKIEEFVIANAKYRTLEHVMITTIRFDLPKDIEAKLKPKDKKKLTEYFEKSLRKELELFPLIKENYPPQEKTYLADIIITDLDSSNVYVNFLLTATVALPFDTGGITVEARIIDLDTQEEVAAFRGYREGTMFHIVGGMTKYGHAEGGMNLYAKEIKKLLENFQCPSCKTKKE